MTLYAERRQPMVMIRVNGVDAPDLMEARLSYSWSDRIGKRQSSTLVLADPDRTIRDGKLQPDDHYQISAGYPGNMSRVRNYRLKEWSTNHDTSAHKVTLKLKHTGRPPSKFQRGEIATSEPHKTHKPKNWGKIQSSDIAKRVARRHGLKAVVDASDDIDKYAYVQPANVTDYGYLRRLASVIDFEFFIDEDKLYYRKKPYDERPRRVFFYKPTSGRDTLLLSFTPTAKVTVVSVSPKAVDIQSAETSWISDEERRLAAEAADLFNNPTSESEEVVRALTAVDIPDGWSVAQGAQDALQSDPSVANQENFDQRMRELDLRLRELQTAKKDLAQNKEGSGKAAHAQGAKAVGSQNKGTKNCPTAQQKDGKTPTGNSPVAGFEETNIRSGDRQIYGASQAVVLTTAGTDEQRGKVACAAHSKRTDKAVTATAKFIGDPSLIAKVNYRFEGVGPMFSGDWYAKEATHTIDDLYIVTMQLKRGKLKKVKGKKGTSDSQSENSTPQSASSSGDQFWELETGRTAIWSQAEQARYNNSTQQSSNGYYRSDGSWVPAPGSSAVPGR